MWHVFTPSLKFWNTRYIKIFYKIKVAPELLRNVASIYVDHTNRFFNMISTSNDIENVTDLETSLIALKSIRRLIVHGFQDISRVDETKVNETIITVIY